MKLQLSGRDFKQLISGATKFPSIGSFAGSEIIQLRSNASKCYAMTFGVVLARSIVPAQGELPLIGIDERILIPFANLHSEATKVIIEVDEKEISIRARGREINAPLVTVGEQKFPKIGPAGLQITQELSARIGFLSAIAFADCSRPELNCVMLATDGRAFACNPNCVTVLKCGIKVESNVAIPIPMARALSSGDVIHASLSETVIKSGCASYCMPTPTKALKEFPIAALLEFASVKTDLFCVVKGLAIAQAATEAQTCLGTVSRLPMIAVLSIVDGKLQLATDNSSIRFQTKIPILKQGVAYADMQVHLPMDELLNAASLVEKEESVSISVGKEKGEAFIRFSFGFAAFPRLERKK